MKIIHFTFIFLVVGNISAQSIEKCGLDDDPNLTANEAAFLNKYLSDRIDGFDFHGKKIIFVSGSSGHQMSNKILFFEAVKSRIGTDSRVGATVLPFSEEQKKASGDYDAIVGYWVKILTPKRVKKLIKKVGAEKTNLSKAPKN